MCSVIRSEVTLKQRFKAQKLFIEPDQKKKKKKNYIDLISVNLAGGWGERWVPGHSESWECSDFILSK